MDGKKKLLMKRKERDNKQLLKAFSESEKTLAEVIEFLQLHNNWTGEEKA